MEIIKFAAAHALNMDLQPIQRTMLGITKDYAEKLEQFSDGLTVMDGDRPVACFGRVQLWEGRYTAWALLDKNCTGSMVKIVRTIKRAMSLQEGTGRYEAIVRSDFPQGRRLAEMLGFKFHHHEERFLPGNLDADIYVRFC